MSNIVTPVQPVVLLPDPFIMGIDAAHWQGLIAFEQFANSGIDFAWFKVTHGMSATPDKQFRNNWLNSKGVFKYGRGGYMWLTSSNPELQIERAVTELERTGDTGELFLSVDFEEPTIELRDLDAAKHLLLALRRAKKLLGGAAMYTGAWYWRLLFSKNFHCDEIQEIVEEYPLWHSQYPRTVLADKRACGVLPPDLPKPTLPEPWLRLGVGEAVWQFDGDGGCVLPSGVDADFNRSTRSRIESVLYKPLTVDLPRSPRGIPIFEDTEGVYSPPLMQIDFGK